MSLIGCLRYNLLSKCIPKKRKSLSIENYYDKSGKSQIEINKLFVRRVESIRVKQALPIEFRNEQPVLIDNISKKKSKVPSTESNGLFRQLFRCQSKSSKPAAVIVDATKHDDTELDCESHVSNICTPKRSSSRTQQRSMETGTKSKHATIKTLHKTHRRSPTEHNQNKKTVETLKKPRESIAKKSSTSTNRRQLPQSKDVFKTETKKNRLRKTISAVPDIYVHDIKTTNNNEKKKHETRLSHLFKPSIDLSAKESSVTLPVAPTVPESKVDSRVEELEKNDSFSSTSTIYTASISESESDTSSLTQWSTTACLDSESEPTKIAKDKITPRQLDSSISKKTHISSQQQQSQIENPIVEKVEHILPRISNDVRATIHRRQSAGVERCLSAYPTLTQKHRSYDAHLASYYLMNLDKNLNSQISCIKPNRETTNSNKGSIKLRNQPSTLEEKPNTIRCKKPLKSTGDTNSLMKLPKSSKNLPVSKQVLRHVTELMKDENARKHYVAAREVESVRL